MSLRSRRHAQRIVGIGLLCLVAVFVAVALRRDWNAVRADIDLLGPADYILASAAALGGLMLLWASWAVVLSGLGAHLLGRDSRTIYFAAQLGKYAPGSVWPAVIQARLGRRNGVAGSTMVASYAIWMGALCAVGALAGSLVLTNPDIGIPWQVVVGSALAATLALPLFLHDRGIPSLVTWAMRRAGRPIDRLCLSGRSSRQATLLAAATWMLFGFHAWLLARPLGAGPEDLPLVIGGFALAFVAGIVIVPLPAGAGLRETILVLTLGVAIARPAAITVALLSRLIMIGAELLLAGLTGVPGAIRWVRSSGAADQIADDDQDEEVPLR